jgi:hypothetical protein
MPAKSLKSNYKLKTFSQINFLLINFFIFFSEVNEFDDEFYKEILKNVYDYDCEKQKSKVRVSCQLELIK